MGTVNENLKNTCFKMHENFIISFGCGKMRIFKSAKETQ